MTYLLVSWRIFHICDTFGVSIILVVKTSVIRFRRKMPEEIMWFINNWVPISGDLASRSASTKPIHTFSKPQNKHPNYNCLNISNDDCDSRHDGDVFGVTVRTHFDISDSRTFQCQIQGPFQSIHKLLMRKDTTIFQKKCNDWIPVHLRWPYD